MLILAILCLSSAQLDIPEPDLGPYLKLETIQSYLKSLLEQNSTLKHSTKGSVQYFTLSLSSPFKKPSIFFVGSLHGGYPMSSYTVLHFLEMLIHGYESDFDLTLILKRADLIFVPVANPVAYHQTQLIYQNQSYFPTILTGLEGADWNCSNNPYAGYNPNFNFDSNFNKNEEKCAETGYSGDLPFESKVSSGLSEVFKEYQPEVLFIFNGIGNKILYPHSSKEKKLPTNDLKFYENLCKERNDCFNYYKVEATNGSFLDYAFENRCHSFEIRQDIADKKIGSSVDWEARRYDEFVIKAVKGCLLDITKGEIVVLEEKCEVDCDNEYNYIKSFSFNLTSRSYSSYYFDLLVNPGYQQNQDLVKAYISVFQVSEGSEILLKFDCDFTEGLVSKCSNKTLPGFSTLKFIINYYSSSEEVMNTNFISVFTASPTHYYSQNITFDEREVNQEDEEYENTKKGIVTGAVLVSSLIFLLFIASIIIVLTTPKQSLLNST